MTRILGILCILLSFASSFGQTTGGISSGSSSTNSGVNTTPKSVAVGGANPGTPAAYFCNKVSTLYCFYAYDSTGSTTPLTELFNGEIYSVTGALSNLRAVYRAHLDPGNTTSTQFQLMAYTAGVHAVNGVGVGLVADGASSIGYYNQTLQGLYGSYSFVGLAPYTITGVVSNGGNCQYTITGSIAFLAGASVTVASAGGVTACNGTFTVLTVDSTTQFTVSQAFSGTYTSGGTAQLNVSTQYEYVNDFSTGDFLNYNQAYVTKTGDILHFNVQQSSGVLSGNFIGYYVSGSPTYLVQATGQIITATGLETGTGLSQVAANNWGGSCNMNASTTCTQTIAHSFTTPICIATQQSQTLTGVSVGCTVSGTTVTVKATTTNSETWGFLVFGNPN